MNQPNIVAIGEPLAELNQIEPDGPFHLGYGGDTSNCVIAAARAGASTGYLTRVGKDLFGDGLLALWSKEGVETSHVLRDDAPTGIYFITHGPKGHEFTYVRKGSAASLLSPADIDKTYISGARVLHVSAISQAISRTARTAVAAAIDIAKAASREICYDTNLRLKLWSLDEARRTIFETIPHATILRPSLDDARILLDLTDPDAIADTFLRMGTGRVVMTLGSEGVLAVTASERHRIPPHAVKLVDASGAGDAFSGAFLAEFIRTGSLEASARFANAAAALSVTRMGTIASYSKRAEILDLLKR
ncbi:MAG: sugar kinase [Aestuariivirga sp.]